ncbi:MAG: nicotinamide-nucleotide amidohydrolase family protein [Hyphomicrobiaceae bacterium]
MTDWPEILDEAVAILALCRHNGMKLATAESCTGGLIAGALTEIAGSSDVFERGFVTYSNAAKTEAIGVPAALIAAHGAVSAEVARAMAEGALARSAAGIAISVTGVAGPGGGSPDKPVGLVHIAAAMGEEPTLHRELRFGNLGRREIRYATVLAAFALVREALSGSGEPG